MLVKLTDVKGQDYWINPLYVRGLVPRKAGLTEVHVVLSVSPWSGISCIKVTMGAEQLATMIDAAMPEAAAFIASAEADADADRQAAAQRAALGM